MKVQNKKILEAANLIKGNLRNKLPESLPFSLSLALAIFIEKADIVLEVINKSVEAIKKTYKIEYEAGKLKNPVAQTELDKFNKEYEELLKQDAEIDIKQIDIKLFDIKDKDGKEVFISPYILSTLMFMIKQ